MRIALEIQRTLDLEALRARRRLFLSRLWTRIRFKQPIGWSEPHPAIIDTGAPYSLIPLSLWPALHLERLTTLPLRGVIPGRAAELRAELAKVSGRLLDPHHVSPRLSLWALLAGTDQVPLILGWAGCLDRVRLTVDARRSRAWFDF